MSKFKGTPGPWTTFDPPLWGDGNNVMIFADDNDENEEVCEVYQQTIDGKRDANIRLITAAPDLLAALIELLPYAKRRIHELNDTMVGSLYPMINEAKLERGEDAIAKALGT